MAYTRLFKYWSGISHYSSTTCKCSCACSLPTFTLHLPVSTLNDSLFPNRSWFMMSNPKILSKTLLVLSHSRATSFPRCFPSFTLTGTASLPPWHQWDWRGLTSTPLTESQCQEATRWKNSKKERVLSRLVAVLLTSSPSPLSCIYANSLCCNTANDTLLKKNQWHNLSLSSSQTLSLSPVVTRSSVPDKDWWLNLRRRPAPQIYWMEGVQPWLAAGTPRRGNCAKHTKRCPTDLNSTFFTFDSFHNKSERNTEDTGMNGTPMDKEGEGLFVLRQSYSGVTGDLSELCQIHSWALNLAANVKPSSMLRKQSWDLLCPQMPPPLALYHRCPSTPQTNLSSSRICCRELTEALRYWERKITHQLENNYSLYSQKHLSFRAGPQIVWFQA